MNSMSLWCPFPSNGHSGYSDELAFDSIKPLKMRGILTSRFSGSTKLIPVIGRFRKQAMSSPA